MHAVHVYDGGGVLLRSQEREQTKAAIERERDMERRAKAEAERAREAEKLAVQQAQELAVQEAYQVHPSSTSALAAVAACPAGFASAPMAQEALFLGWGKGFVVEVLLRRLTEIWARAREGTLARY